MRLRIVIASAALGAGALVAVPASGAVAEEGGGTAEYTVVAAAGVSTTSAVAAIQAAGGTVVASNADVGVYRVRGSDTTFAARAAAQNALVGAVHQIPIGRAPRQVRRVDPAQEDTSGATSQGHRRGRPGTPAPGMDPLDDRQWGLRMVKSDQARRINGGDRRVTVGILDTGVEAAHPDIAPNFDWRLSRNFAPDIPLVDGECEVPSCLDPVGIDDGGHGTHVAGIVGAAVNGFGLSGVAPNVSLVELKGGQDSGFFFLEPVVNALTYAANSGIDVVNMSFFVDPWLYNCLANPADAPAAQAEQRAIIVAMTRALTFAHLRGVTLVGSLGNNHEDLGNPRTDVQSPNFPPEPPINYDRPIDNATCVDLPVEGPFVIGTSALGPSGKKADYSNYGLEQISVSAPGGWFRDGFGTPTFRTNENMILSPYPLKVLQEEGRVDENGNVNPGFETEVIKQCAADGRCWYWRYLQGTSMSGPHAAGVAALIVSRFGKHDPRNPGLRLEPWKTERMLLRTAAEHACPEPRLQSYTNEGRPAEFDAFCAGGTQFNGFYGHGIVDAFAAVTAPPAFGS